MWALCDVSMLLLVYRVNVVIKDTPAKSVLSTRYFERAESNTTVYVPAEVMDDEKRKFGKHRPTVAAVKDESKSSTVRSRKRAIANRSKVVEEVPSKQIKREDPVRQQPRRAAKSDIKIEHEKSEDDDEETSLVSADASDSGNDEDEAPNRVTAVKSNRRSKNDSSTAVSYIDTYW
jgi:hypothetical protein